MDKCEQKSSLEVRSRGRSSGRRRISDGIRAGIQTGSVQRHRQLFRLHGSLNHNSFTSLMFLCKLL